MQLEEKKQREIEKKRRQEIRSRRDMIEERTIEAEDKRMRVKKDLQAKDNKAYEDYRRELEKKRV